ncbi:MAG: translation initiation factor IF-2 [Pseudomonadota bacterium]
MSETKDTTETTSSGRKQIQLKRPVESGHVQQKFSGGRSKSVEVVKKKTRPVRTPGRDDGASGARGSNRGGQRPAAGRSGGQAGGLSDSELEARARALAAAQVRAREDERRRAAEAEKKAAEEAERKAKEQAEAEAEKKRLAEEAIRKATNQDQHAEAAAAQAEDGSAVPSTMRPVEKADAGTSAASRPSQARRQEGRSDTAAPAARGRPSRDRDSGTAGRGRADGRRDQASGDRSEAQRRPQASGRSTAPVLDQPVGMTRPMIVTRTDRPSPKPAEAKAEAEAPRRPVRQAPAARKDDDDSGKRKTGGKAGRGSPRGGDQGRVRGKLTITNAFDERQREKSLASLKRKREREKMKAMGISQTREKVTREVTIPEVITIQELANLMAERAVDIIKYLMKQGAMHKITDAIDADTAELLVSEFGHKSKRVSEADVEEGFIGGEDVEEALQPRPPVVTIMGHVDHGKTSLLDALRSANVVSGEAGGITQHIGAYQVRSPGGDLISFIDTPGHAAFTAMRARGARVTDIVILVVAADDGVMPQTVEAINHAKAAEVPIIVAINKIDKPDADPNRVRTELLQHEIVVEGMSGDVQEVEVSALQRTNLDSLLEAISLQAEILELKANPERSAEGFVIEAKLERGRGPVGTLLVQRGTLNVGDIVVAGGSWGRVRALIDDKGANTKSAGPSCPVEVLGFDSAPEAGDQFAVVESEARAREITEYRIRKRRETLGSAGSARTLEQMMQQLHESDRKEVPLVIKGDVQGSVEAIIGALQKLSTDEVEARIIHSAVGGITESDVTLANASNAVILGFNVRANTQAKQAAEQNGIELRYYNIIYDLVDDVKAAMSGLLAPTIREIFLGNAEILQVFNISKVGKVAGCRVTEGRVERGAKVRLIRDNVVIHEGTLGILKRFKDDVKEVPVGQECGMSFTNYQDIREGDVIECFNVESVARTLD